MEAYRRFRIYNFNPNIQEKCDIFKKAVDAEIFFDIQKIHIYVCKDLCKARRMDEKFIM